MSNKLIIENTLLKFVKKKRKKIKRDCLSYRSSLLRHVYEDYPIGCRHTNKCKWPEDGIMRIYNENEPDISLCSGFLK